MMMPPLLWRKESKWIVEESRLYYRADLVVLYSVLWWGCWIGNVVKLARCDWSDTGTWKGEVVHLIGVFVPPASAITVWSDEK